MPYRTRRRAKKLCFPQFPEDTALIADFHAADSPRLLSNMVSQMEADDPAETPQLGFPEVMAAIVSCQATLTSEIEAVQLDVSLIRQDQDKL